MRNEKKLREKFNISILFDDDGAEITGSAESCETAMKTILFFIKKAEEKEGSSKEIVPTSTNEKEKIMSVETGVGLPPSLQLISDNPNTAKSGPSRVSETSQSHMKSLISDDKNSQTVIICPIEKRLLGS